MNSPAARMASRRTVLTAAGVTALMVTANAGRASAAGRVDAIVIGAGFAGVTAARALGEQGRQTLLLEARDRIGGRTWTSTFAGEQIELGGAWVAESQPHVWREIEHYGLPLVADVAPERAIFPTSGGFGSFDPAEAFARQGTLITRLFEGAQEYFPRPHEPFFREDLLRKLDQLSMRDRLDQLRFSPEDEAWVSGTTAGLSGGTSKRGALTQLAQWWALSGWNIDGWNSVNVYRPQGGTIRLLKAILADAPAELRLNSPVAEVVDDGSEVQVITRKGERFSAPVVVVAVPVNVWKTIKFSPRLPQAHTVASAAGIAVPNSVKLWLHIRGLADRLNAQAPEGYTISNLISHTPLADGQLMIGFSDDPALDVSNREQVEAAVRHIIPEISVVEVRGQVWGRNDEFSLGGHSCKQPGQLTVLLRAIQQPWGRLAFATSDNATGWSGYIDGAIESGVRAARQIAAL